MADVSVQNERINGWIPSSATNVIMNWPERIKTQPHDDRDNCFLPFDSKGPCGMTVNNDIDDDSATKHSDSHSSRSWEPQCLPKCGIWSIVCMLFAICNSDPQLVSDMHGELVSFPYLCVPVPADGEALRFQSIPSEEACAAH